MSEGSLFLMYHELQGPGLDISKRDPGYRHYIVRAGDFRDQLSWLKFNGFTAITVSEALSSTNAAGNAVVITFDDGVRSDLTVAAPLLKEFGFSATFYLTSGLLGRKGFLGSNDVRELAREGFEIGCHSRNHRSLDHLGEADLEEEIIQAKAELEAIIGVPVEHYACPGGSWSPLAVQVAKRAGFKSMATSRIGRNSRTTDRYRLARIPIFRGDNRDRFKSLCVGRGLFLRQSRAHVVRGLRMILGDSVYEKWWHSSLLRGCKQQ
jgi:peptidoglycan/xylan/chitin deacetylase (PgdA/CDA1 family)